MNEGLVCHLLQPRSIIWTRRSVIDQDVLLAQKVVLDHIVRNLAGQHWVLNWVELVDVDDAK